MNVFKRPGALFCYAIEVIAQGLRLIGSNLSWWVGIEIPRVPKQRLLGINYSESQKQLTNLSDLVILRTSTRFIAC